MRFITLFLLTIVLLNVTCSFAQQIITSLKIENVSPGNVDSKAFRLFSDADVSIRGTAGYFKVKAANDHIFYSWLLDSKTRRMVWHSLQDTLTREENGILRYQTRLKLKKGTYELYYSGTPEKSDEISNISDFLRQLGNSVSNLFNDNMKTYSPEYNNKLEVIIEAPDSVIAGIDYKDLIQEIKSEAVISLTGITNENKVQKGFSLSRNLKLDVYCLGEYQDNILRDYGWITDLDRNLKVWQISGENSLPAGGALKNILSKGVIELPEGNYQANYISDKSHSSGNWNSLPPYDPQFWGLTVKVLNDSDRSAVSFIKDDYYVSRNTIAEIIKVGDNEFLKKSFTLDKDTNAVRIIAIGEGDASGMYDYGWISDEKTRIPVWEMKYSETTEAGGSRRYRLFNNVIKLPRGIYAVYFLTDDLNSYQRFVIAAPDDKENYGIRLLEE